MTDLCSIKEACKMTSLKTSRMQNIAEKVGADCNSGIPVAIINEINKELEQYISFLEFASTPRGERYDGISASRNKLLDELENNDYYGIQRYDPSDLLIGLDEDIVYFQRIDIPTLERHLTRFFDLFAFTEQEKIEKLLSGENRKETKKCIRMYMKSSNLIKTITPSCTEFVSFILSLPDLHQIENADIQQILEYPMTVATKNMLIDFFNKVRIHVEQTKYSQLKSKKRESKAIPAYSDETYIALAKCLFNAEYIAEHKMIERALENHWYIEMWLYLSLLYCCGWRGGDVCRGWKYLHLKDKPDNQYGINVETLHDDILYDRLPDRVYEDVGKYVCKSIELSCQMPSKTAGTSAPTLVISITPELQSFFGLLTLISEAVMIHTGDGYMHANREYTYQKKTMYRQFFGQEMYEILHGCNIQSRRLNKDYLQGIEQIARQTGCGSLMASALASFARSHKNLDTISHYLKDHKLHAENADMVLYFMLERGVFGFELYQTLLTAYPDVLKKLPMKKQNEIIKGIAESPYQIELAQSGIATILYVQEHFEEGNIETVTTLLKGMYEIAQGRAKGKDEGVHCICRARGDVCIHPEYDSCLANVCPYFVFTRYGYRALLDILAEYKRAAEAGDIKMAAVLQEVMMPRFRDILNALFRETKMSQEDKTGMKMMLVEVLDDAG